MDNRLTVTFTTPDALNAQVSGGIWQQDATPTINEVIAGTGALAGTHFTQSQGPDVPFQVTETGIPDDDGYKWVVVVEHDGNQVQGTSSVFGGTVLPPDYIPHPINSFKVPAGDRMLKVSQDNRGFVVKNKGRAFVPKSESRLLRVKTSDRTFIVTE